VWPGITDFAGADCTLASMRVLVAPDKFRGTLTASEAAEGIRRGWTRGRAADDVSTVPMADGGEGTLEAMVSALRGRLVPATVTGPLGDPVVAQYGIIEAAGGTTAVVEMARASGLALLGEERDAARATTFGTGELIADALERHHPSAVLVCIGGSATTDGGAGMAQALGARLVDRGGGDLAPGGRALLDLDRIELGGLARAVAGVRFIVASDVDNPLIGANGAAVVYGPQKGATPEDVVLLDRALAHYAAVVHRDLGVDVRATPGAGAAGGLGAGLLAFTGARVRPGAEVVMDAVGLPERLTAADVAITGEGTLDGQSLRGKAVAGVIAAAREAAVPVIVICGRADVRPSGVTVASLVERFGDRAALEDTRRSLESLAEEVAAGVADGSSSGEPLSANASGAGRMVSPERGEPTVP
jgi:glycerate 2-kinase